MTAAACRRRRRNLTSCSLREDARQPCLCEAQVAHRRRRRDGERFTDLLQRQPAEVAELRHLRLARELELRSRQRLVETGQRIGLGIGASTVLCSRAARAHTGTARCHRRRDATAGAAGNGGAGRACDAGRACPAGAGVPGRRRACDARFAIVEQRDGRIVIALTGFDALDSMLGAIPFGIAIPMMSALMGVAGCQRALMLCGGISAQLAVALLDETRHERIGLRKVPLGIVGVPR